MDDKKYLETFGKRIINYRKAKKMTQIELAQKLGVKYPMIGRIERGGVDCRISTVRRIAKELGISVGEIMDIE